MGLEKSDIVPLLQHATLQNCEYVLLRPQDILEASDCYNDIDLLVRNECADSFLNVLRMYSETRNLAMSIKQIGLFKKNVLISHKDAQIILDIENKINLRGVSVVDYASVLDSSIMRSDVRFIGQEMGDVVILAKELFRDGNLQRKPQWWTAFVRRVQNEPDTYERLLKDHLFACCAGSMVARIQSDDVDWIRRRRLLFTVAFLITRLSRNLPEEISGFLKWLRSRTVRWIYD